MGGLTIHGIKELDSRLQNLSTRGSKRAMRSGVKGALGVVAKAARREINATDAPGSAKREARRSIGSRYVSSESPVVAKVGFKVGMTSKQRSKKIELGKKGKHGSGGVGASVANIHWFVLGTDERPHPVTGTTGKMEPMFEDVIQQAWSSSQGAALEAARKKIARVIESEAKKP